MLFPQVYQQAEQLRELGDNQTKLLRKQLLNDAVGKTTHTRRPEILKANISKYRGVWEDSLLLWFVKLDRSIIARRIDGEQMKLTFSQTHLTGRVKTWDFGLEMSDAYSFESLEAFKTRPKQRFEPPRAEFRA